MGTSSSAVKSGKWIVVKPYEVLVVGDEFTKVFCVANPRDIEYRFTFYSTTRSSFEIETAGFNLIDDGYVRWIGPDIGDIVNQDLKSQLDVICSNPFNCQKEEIEYLYKLCPLEIEAWAYLAGHEPARQYLVKLAQQSRASALIFFTQLNQEASNLFPGTTMDILGSLGSPIALLKILEKLKQRDPISRRHAYEQLEYFEGPEIHALLTAGTQDSNWNVQSVAKRILASRSKPD